MKNFLAILGCLAILAAFAVPAGAQEATTEERLAALEEAFQCQWKFYGSARMSTFWYKDDDELTGNGFDDTDMDWLLQGNSRIGASVKLGDVSGRFEYGHGPNPSLRLLYGEWNFGPGKLLLGQDYTPMTYWISNQVAGGDNDLLGFGQMYTGRMQQIKLTFGSFQLAAVRPVTGVAVNNIVTGLPFNNDTDAVIPQFQAGYDFNLGPLGAHVSGAYQTYDATVIIPFVSETEYSIDAWELALGAKYAMGPFFAKGDIYFGENVRNLGQSSSGMVVVDRAYYNPVTNGIIDCDTLGFALIAGFKVNDMLTFEVGYGEANNEWDNAGVTIQQDVKSFYLNATINLAKGVFIVPEIGKFDYGEMKITGIPDIDMGSTNYFGAKWQINF